MHKGRVGSHFFSLWWVGSGWVSVISDPCPTLFKVSAVCENYFSQGSVATRFLSLVGYFDESFVANFPERLAVKEF